MVMGSHHRHLGWTSHQRPATFRNVQRGTTDWEMAAPEVAVVVVVVSEVKGMGLGTWHPPDVLGNRTEEMAPRMSVEGCHFSADSQPRLWFPQIW